MVKPPTHTSQNDGANWLTFSNLHRRARKSVPSRQFALKLEVVRPESLEERWWRTLRRYFLVALHPQR